VDYRVALTYLAEGHIDSAAHRFGSAAQADSGFSEAWANWGTAALTAENYPEALARYRVAVTGAPNSPVLWTNLAWAHYLAGQPDSARTAIVRALVADSTFGPARALAAQLEAQQPQ
jgi:Tfp pilus assembly protein PilF